MMVVFIILFGVIASQVYSTGQNIPFMGSFLYGNYSSTRLLKKNSNSGLSYSRKQRSRDDGWTGAY